MSNIVNKVKDAVTGHHSTTEGAHHDTAATHGTHGTHNTTGTHGTTGAGLTGTHGTHGTHNTTAGPHSSDMANKVDPRVDSDRDGSRTMGGAGPGMGATYSGHTTGLGGSDTAYGHTGHGVAGGHSTGMTGTHGTHGTTGTGLTGAHGTHGTTGTGMTGTHGTHGTTGAGLTGTHGTHGTGTHNTTGESLTGGPGPAPKTAGPHKSDMMNKLDPRVDSDLDGSKTMGGDKTFSSGTGGHM